MRLPCDSINVRERPWASKPQPINYKRCCTDRLNSHAATGHSLAGQEQASRRNSFASVAELLTSIGGDHCADSRVRDSAKIDAMNRRKNRILAPALGDIEETIRPGEILEIFWAETGKIERQ